MLTTVTFFHTIVIFELNYLYFFIFFRKVLSDFEKEFISLKPNSTIIESSIAKIKGFPSYKIVYSENSVTPAHALTRYYNCIARIANKNATLSISNVNNCYNMIFKGALDYYGIKSSPIASDDNFSDHHDICKKPVHNHEAELQAIVNEQSQDIFG
jgi:hypothetical protein